eukprot:gene49112-10076_t
MGRRKQAGAKVYYVASAMSRTQTPVVISAKTDDWDQVIRSLSSGIKGGSALIRSCRDMGQVRIQMDRLGITN